jgi:para-aminobenzoate synthetase/4-amino-4-deoxychorismate lyase
MTSGVEARLPEDVDFKRLMQALYPPGSVTGAPKVRAVEIIRELESEPRGVYTGSTGMLKPGGGCRFNVAIRTLRIARDGRMEIGIGSGVVQDSRAQSEYDECLLKMRFLTDPMLEFDLIETLRFDRDGGYVLLDHHLARLAASARRLGFAFERAAVAAALDHHAASLTSPHTRVRLTLSRSGCTHITGQPIDLPRKGATIRVALAQTRLDPANLFLYHKTTYRGFYDDERVRLAAATGCDEVIFLNTRGELTEGSFTNLFVEMRGAMLTPPLTSGLLAGTLRQQLLAEGRAREAVLTLRDLRGADAVWLGNSVRGLLRAEFVEPLPLSREPAEAEAASSP